jgi:hypothetical protein
MGNWIKKILTQENEPEKPKPVTKPVRKIGINKNYDPSVWQKNRFKQVESS